MSTVIKSIFVGIVISFVAANSSFAQYYPTGIVENISEQTLISNGWIKHYEQTYGTPIPDPETTLKPTGQYTILAGKSSGSNTITLAAAAPTSDVFTQTALNAPRLVNGSYWYYRPVDMGFGGGSMGFAESSTINQMTADTQSQDLNTRLSWHIVYTGIGGYRLGSIVGLNNSNDYIKQVWTWTPTAALVTSPTITKTSGFYFSDSYTANQSHFLSDPDGQLRKTVDYIKLKFGSLIRW